MNATEHSQSVETSTSALISISDMRMVLPQVEIRALEAAGDVDTQDPEPCSVGWIQYLQQRWPTYCLSSNLDLLTDIPRERRACILLASGTNYVGILCDEVKIARQNDLGEQHELPSSMRLPDTPVLGLITVNDNDVGCLTNAEQLMTHITRLINI
jgi:hypothetical protein